MVAGVCVALILVCIAIYGQTLSHEFLNYDDGLYVTENPQVQAGLSLESIGWAFVSDKAMYFHPLTWMSHMLDCSLYGMHPWGHHLTSLVFHAASSVLLFLALRLLTGALWSSAAVAALFAVHPLHVESVAWVAERKDVLSAFFWMLALGAYGLYVRRRGALRYAVVAAAFVLGLMSKPMVVTLPFVLLLLDYWPLGRVNRDGPFVVMVRKAGGLAVEKIPLFLITALSCVSTVMMQASGNNLYFGEKVPFAARCANAAVVYVLYLAKTVWPSGLAAFYPHPIARPAWQVAGAVLMLAAITLFCLRHARRRPYLIVGWFWYLGTLVPVIELVQAGNFSHADRYTYIPLIGVFIMAAWGVADLAAAWRAPRPAVTVASGIALAALTVCAGVQAGYWHDSGTLFRHAIAVGQESGLAFNNLGLRALNEGRYDEADVCLTKAVELDPEYVNALTNMGVLAMHQKRRDEAKAYLTKAMGLAPREVRILNNLGLLAMEQGRNDEARTYLKKALDLKPDDVNTLNNLGELAMGQGRYDEAGTCLRKALELKPDQPAFLINLGKLALVQRRYDEARTCLTKALGLDPENVKALNNLGALAINQSHYDEAEPYVTKALDLQPDCDDALNNLVLIAIKLKHHDSAKAYLTKALELNAGNIGALKNLGKLTLDQGHLDEARTYLAKALELDPKCVSALNNLGGCFMEQGQYEEAQRYFRKALDADPQNIPALNNLGDALAKLGRQEEANGYIKKAAELGQAPMVSK